MKPFNRDMKRFTSACDVLLILYFVMTDLSESEREIIHHYIVALSKKFPALQP